MRALLQKGADAHHKDSHGNCAVDILGVEALDVRQAFDEQVGFSKHAERILILELLVYGFVVLSWGLSTEYRV